MTDREWLEDNEEEEDLFRETVQFDNLVLPGLTTFNNMRFSGLKEPDELIQGILRRKRKMLLSGPSKSAKSCMLMELAVSLTEGIPWLGFQCKKSNVLYVNLELEGSTACFRIKRIYEEFGINAKHDDCLIFWNLRGYSNTIQVLADPIVRICHELRIDVVIIDPIYKVLNGDENNAGEIGKVCNTLDWIAREGNCAVIFSHHHSKGAKGNRQVLDRSSGSGVFGRDPDAILDLIQLEPSAAAQERMGGNLTTAWRMEAVLREFQSIDPINCWFRFPIHIQDPEGLLDDCSAVGSYDSNLNKSSRRVSLRDREAAFIHAFDELSEDGRPVKIADMAKKMSVSQQTVRNRHKDVEDRYWLENNMIGRLNQSA